MNTSERRQKKTYFLSSKISCKISALLFRQLQQRKRSHESVIPTIPVCYLENKIGGEIGYAFNYSYRGESTFKLYIRKKIVNQDPFPQSYKVYGFSGQLSWTSTSSQHENHCIRSRTRIRLFGCQFILFSGPLKETIQCLFLLESIHNSKNCWEIILLCLTYIHNMQFYITQYKHTN